MAKKPEVLPALPQATEAYSQIWGRESRFDGLLSRVLDGCEPLFNTGAFVNLSVSRTMIVIEKKMEMARG